MGNLEKCDRTAMMLNSTEYSAFDHLNDKPTDRGYSEPCMGEITGVKNATFLGF